MAAGRWPRLPGAQGHRAASEQPGDPNLASARGPRIALSAGCLAHQSARQGVGSAPPKGRRPSHGAVPGDLRAHGGPGGVRLPLGHAAGVGAWVCRTHGHRPASWERRAQDRRTQSPTVWLARDTREPSLGPLQAAGLLRTRCGVAFPWVLWALRAGAGHTGFRAACGLRAAQVKPPPRSVSPCCQSGRAGYLGAVSCKVSSVVAIIITATTVSPELAGAVLSPR